jgi:putative transposase
MAIKKEIVDELLKDVDPKAVFSSEGLMAELKKALAERILNAEMDQHLESEAAGGPDGAPTGNHRNGYSKKTVLTDNSQIELEVPRDRRGTFEPQLIAKYQRRFPGFDDKIISMYARGMSVRVGDFRHEDQAISRVGTHLRWDAGGAVGDDDYSALDPAASFLALTPR